MEEEARLEEEKKKLEEEQLRLVEEKKLAEAKLKEQIAAEFVETKAYLERTKVAGFLFGSIKEGRHRQPLFVGAVLNDQQ